MSLTPEFTLTPTPAPPKNRPRKKNRAVWPDEPIKAPTRGIQRPLFKVRGQQLTLEDKE